MRRRSTVWVVRLLVSLAGAQAFAESVSQVRCTGLVRDAKARPVAGTKVTLYGVSFNIAGNIVTNRMADVTTGPNGAFTFVAEDRRDDRSFLDGYIVAVKAGTALGWAVWDMHADAKKDIELGRTSRVEGVIVDETGRPVAGADVCANLSRTTETAQGKEVKEWLPGIAPMQGLSSQTDRKGRFLIEGLPEGVDVDLLVRAAGRAQVYTWQSGPAFRTGQTDIKVAVPVEGRIAGRLLDQDTGQGAARIRLRVVSSSLFYDRFVCVTDKEGRFDLGGLKSGRHYIGGDGLPGTDVEVRPGETTQVTITMNKAWYGRILFDDGQPVPAQSDPPPGSGDGIYLAEDRETMGQRVSQLDSEGYFKVYLSREQHEKLQSGAAWFYVHVPEGLDPKSKAQRMRQETVLATDLLAGDKEKAGLAKIPRGVREPISLVGKPLPSLAGLCKDLSEIGAEGKPLLLYFLDIEQRPSRRLLPDLARTVEKLAGKGVSVVVIQTSKVDLKQYEDWLKTNQITFPVHTIEGDFETKKVQWGVKALPWLILTDNGHIVVAEGFSVNELSDKTGLISGRRD